MTLMKKKNVITFVLMVDIIIFSLSLLRCLYHAMVIFFRLHIDVIINSIGIAFVTSEVLLKLFDVIRIFTM